MAPIFLLAETSAGYALFKAKDKKLLKEDAFSAEEQTVEGVCNMLKLKNFSKFDSAQTGNYTFIDPHNGRNGSS